MLRLSANVPSICERSLCYFARGIYVMISVNNFLHIVMEISTVNTLKSKIARSDALREAVIEISRRILLAAQEIFDFTPQLLKLNLKIAKKEAWS